MTALKSNNNNFKAFSLPFESVNYLKSENEMYLKIQRHYPDISATQLSRIQPDLLLALYAVHPSIPTNRAVLISLEAARQRVRLSKTPFYANRAAKYGNSYWIRLAISYQGDD